MKKAGYNFLYLTCPKTFPTENWSRLNSSATMAYKVYKNEKTEYDFLYLVIGTDKKASN